MFSGALIVFAVSAFRIVVIAAAGGVYKSDPPLNLSLIHICIEKLRFNRPVLAGDAVRLRASLVSLANLRGIAKAEIKVSLEIKDSPKTALDATVVFLYHFQ